MTVLFKYMRQRKWKPPWCWMRRTFSLSTVLINLAASTSYWFVCLNSCEWLCVGRSVEMVEWILDVGMCTLLTASFFEIIIIIIICIYKNTWILMSAHICTCGCRHRSLLPAIWNAEWEDDSKEASSVLEWTSSYLTL